MAQPRHQPEVLGAGEEFVDGGELSRHANGPADPARFIGHGMAAHHGGAPVSLDQGGEDLDGCGFTGTVGAEQGKHPAAFDLQIDAVQNAVLAETLSQAADIEGEVRGGSCAGHDGSFFRAPPR
nr:hypothetical protein [Arthrobacter sp. CDRTa11]